MASNPQARASYIQASSLISAHGLASEPLTAREIAERVLVAANVANPDKDAVADLAGSVLASLRNHRGKGRGAGRRGQPGAVEAQQSRQVIVNLNRHDRRRRPSSAR
jgi:hypothetical protein